MNEERKTKIFQAEQNVSEKSGILRKSNGKKGGGYRWSYFNLNSIDCGY